MNAPTQTELFNEVAAKAGKTTIMQATPTGEYLVWVTANETEPVTSLLSAALSIMVRRGLKYDGKGITLRKVLGVVAPGCEHYWQVTDQDGREIASGYAATEDAAANAMAPWLVASSK